MGESIPPRDEYSGGEQRLQYKPFFFILDSSSLSYWLVIVSLKLEQT